ncbi:MAG: formate/nitrite transporter family protein [Gemmatimonadetes bacterium]|nr:formate/nitrite transporter family protein [Gemmatimonadota bacterium]NIQ54324.1 formate/nitrite transporter family protein [Gemmatimonadota bacterium]NIU74534.1 formate/nitrite transporter family protein [Gammaproteobacteria bacterium]NIX44475.1 formate/nitrite transporter family protein [Gemmatimonadota bacterium]NIY08703.1 formate/nitrite transporter family protein [Gemmatimonadota bacterium]
MVDTDETGRPDETEPPPSSPDLTEEEIEKAEQETPLNADITFEVIRRRGEEELARPSAALFFSGLAAGLSMGFSLLAEGFLHTYLPEAAWTPLVSKLGYSVGFLMVILGSQQLFTENTLTAIIPLLARRTGSALLNVCRLWGVVLLANLLGAAIFAWGIAHTSVLDPVFHESLRVIGLEAAEGTTAQLILQGIFAGWLIALMVWMLPATQGGKTAIIVLMTYLIGLGGFPHIIAGSVEVLYAVAIGGLPWTEYLIGWAPATLLGNILGGVALVSALNYAQVFAGGGRKRDRTAWLNQRGPWRIP